MEQLFKQLRNPDPAVRRAAIIEIGKRGDPQALSALKYVHQNDPDLKLRELAYKAGAHIAKQAKARQSAPPPPPPPEPEPDEGGFKWYGDLFEDDMKKPPEQTEKVNISPQDEQRAKSLLSRALDYYMRGDRSKAADNLAKALDIDPNLRKDPVANGLAQDITGLAGAAAINSIMHKDTRKNMFLADRQQKTQQKLAETATDLTIVATYLAGFWVLLTVGYSLIYYLLLNVFVENFDTVMPQQQGNSSVQFNTVRTSTLIIGAIFQSTWGTFTLATVGASIHIIARWVLVGSGTMLGFLKRLIPYMATVLAVSFAIYIIFIITADASIFVFMTFGYVFGTLFVVYYLSQLVSSYYDLGGCAGCFAVVVGFILWIIMLIGAFYAFLAAVL